MTAAAAATRQNMAPELNPHDECDLGGEFDARCRISVHYASTPAMDNNGKREEELDSCKRIQSCSRFPSRNSFSIRRRSRLAERIINLCRQIEEDWSRNPRVRPPFREPRDSIIRCSRREGGREKERAATAKIGSASSLPPGELMKIAGAFERASWQEDSVEPICTSTSL